MSRLTRPARTQASRATTAGGQRSLARTGLALTALSVALTLTVALLGPSVAEPALPGRSGQPPWSFAAHPSPYLVVALTALSLGAGTAGLALTMLAARRGWLVPAWMLLAAGIAVAAALAFLPPFGSSDQLNYAAYGRMAVLGHDPYTTTPAQLARLGDPVGRAVRQFSTTPSVYGALGTAGQALASLIGGTSVRLTVFILSLLNAAAFSVTGVLLHWLTRGDRRRQLRAALLWAANPVLLQVLVAGQHIDSQAVMFAVAAVAAFSLSRLAGQPAADAPAMQAAVTTAAGETTPVPSGGARRRLATAAPAAAAGVLIGLGFSVKVTMVLAGAGIGAACLVTWLVRRSSQAPSRWWRTEPLVASFWLAAGAAVAAAAGLAAWGISSLQPGLRAGSFVSNGSPWRSVRVVLALVLSEPAAEDVVKLAAVAFGAFLLLRLLRSVRYWPGGWPAIGRTASQGTGPATRRGWPAGNVPVLNLVIWIAAAIALAWLFSWPYVLPWYDAIGWALIALLPASAMDWLLLARTAALGLGYLTAAVGTPPAGLHWLEPVVRTGVVQVVLLAAVIGLILLTRPARAGAAMRS
jgi:hypothetical protein